ncbi:MAG: hypothetical protein HC934_07450 [Acaryochloridaceae cyanobacterium SU_2_1]|nr:hypothetical protein [Acaryochloridaceae cyanobacterium SU_2_1]
MDQKNEPQAVVCAACNAPLILRDRYRAERIIGQGGFGRTILAHDIQLPGNPIA